MSAKIRRLVVGKGVTTRPGESEEWVKRYYELELEVPESFKMESFEEARVKAEAMIEKWLSEEEVPYIPQLDIAEIDALPWKKTDHSPAKPGEFAWLFGPSSFQGVEPGAEKLVKAIKASKDGKLVLGDMEYSLVKSDTFIQRKPVKKKE